MARATVVHSTDAAKIIFKGDKRKPEPSLGVIEFPGGHVEVSRCSDGTYWAHIYAVDPKNVIDGRIDRTDRVQSAGDLEDSEHITKIAIRIKNNVPRLTCE